MSKKSFVILIGIGFIATYLLFVGVARWGDSTPPEIVLTQPFTEAGPTTPLVIHISDTDTGLKDISVRIVHNLETFTLVEESFPSHGFLSLDGGIEREYDLEMVPYADMTLPRKKGETKLIVTARDYSWSNFFEGNGERLTQEVTLKFSAPRLELLSPPGSIAQEGRELSGIEFPGKPKNMAFKFFQPFIRVFRPLMETGCLPSWLFLIMPNPILPSKFLPMMDLETEAFLI